jgi:ankyrin repeat protein
MYKIKYGNSSDIEKAALKSEKHDGNRKKYDEEEAKQIERLPKLHKIVYEGENVQLVEEAVKAGCDIHELSSDGFSALHIACYKGHAKVLEKLIELGAKVNQLSTFCGTSPLMIAARQNCVESVTLLLANSAVDVNLHNERHETALHFAVGAGSLESARLLLKAGAKVNYSDKEGLTPLLVATRMKDYKLVKLLIDAKANVHYVDPVGRTLLHWAADLGAADIVELLFECHVNIDATDTNGHTPFVCAIKNNQPKVVKLLLDAGCDQHSVDGLMGTPLALASVKGFVECCDVLLDAGADCDEVSFFGTTPLILAVFESKIDVVKLLLRRGANPNSLSRVGTTAIFKCLMHVIKENEVQRHEIITILLRAGANVNFRVSRSSYFSAMARGRNCPLAFAMSSGYISLVKMLLLAGARVSRAEVASWMSEHHEMQIFDTAQLLDIVLEWTSEPTSLKHACRIAIRAALGDKVAANIDQLPLANSLKRFLNFSEFDNVMIERTPITSEYSVDLLNLMPQMKSCTLNALEGTLLHTTLTRPATALPRLPYTRGGCPSQRDKE